MSVRELRNLPLTPASYELLRGVSLYDCSMELFLAFYDWHERYGRKLRPVMRYWFMETAEQWNARVLSGG